jgi:predicted permease
MNVDVSIVGALLPVFAVIVSGYGLRSFGFPGDTFWPHAERLTYFVLFPSLLLQKTAAAPLNSEVYLLLAAALFAAVLVMTFLLFLLLPWWSLGKETFTSFFQGSIRFNTYVGLAAAFALFGNEGLTVASIAIAVLIPLLNVICVSILVVFCRSDRTSRVHSRCGQDTPGVDTGSWRTVASEIIRNPLVLACAIGTLLNVSGTGLHQSLNDILMIFSKAALPLGLLSVGAGLNFTAARKSGLLVAASCVLKLIAFPLVMWITCRIFSINTMATSIAVLFAALPGSPAAYILSKQLGGDSLLMASIITVQTPLSMVTIPVVMEFIQ